uniref:Uncharacterized protein n=1 Tax=Rhodosorus marinus TaxID=101924 RepID=A0A6T6MJ05_9RHOD|mmetsp:Transcript_23220/g.33294  ORF Transcript_23220/g.33294 Transcript_23220/m.33294 type:complete len:161 (+) Transcript_23220:2-484(+)
MGKGKGSGRRNAPLRKPNQVGPEIPDDGTPVFTILVRSDKGAKLWYPCGAVQGDKRAKGLVEGMQSSWGKALYGSALDRGIAGTVYKDGSRFAENAVRMFPALRSSMNNLQFGYRISAAGMETTKTKLITEEMGMPFLKWIQYKVSSQFEELTGQKAPAQ